MKRGGIASLDRSSINSSYDSLSSSIVSAQLAQLQLSHKTFQSSLRTFIQNHRSKILSDPIFRQKFSELCREIGIDPLGYGEKKTSVLNLKGIGSNWFKSLGVSDWTYELAVQIVDICLSTRDRNGGLIEMEELLKSVTRMRNGPSNVHISSSGAISSTSSSSPSINPSSLVTKQDILEALRALEPLGCGYQVVKLADQTLIRSIPSQFDTDSLSIIECASESGTGYVTQGMLWEWTRKKKIPNEKGWSIERVSDALDKALMMEGLVWLEESVGSFEGGEEVVMNKYWVLALFDFTDEVGEADVQSV